VTNRSTIIRTLALSDGSSVVLYPNSELVYDSLFQGDTRSVLLRGKADFKVATDKSKPFIVTHGNIATHVLGTRFTVWAPVKEKTQRIRLYEGKVMIRAADSIRKSSTANGIAGALKGSYYLSPGQEFVYDELHNTGQVRTFDTTPLVAAAAARNKEDITLPDHSKGSWFMFNNQPLSEVFDELQSVYNVRIVYKETDLHKMYFIGKFDASDSLNVILSRMATLYHLKIIRKQDKFIISK
jgi:ferric-dicitrate binding protein FerR (iron transport regulator)